MAILLNSLDDNQGNIFLTGSNQEYRWNLSTS